jgi:hypothetical protein
VTTRSISLPEALSTLDDRCGETVLATLDVVLAEGTSRVLAAAGALAHWHTTQSAWAWSGEPRRDVPGVYSVGDAIVDVTQLRPTSILEHDGTDDGLTFDLDDQVILTIAWTTSGRQLSAPVGST